MRRPLARAACRLLALAVLLAGATVVAPAVARAHPMGNFSISHYSAIRVLPGAVEVHYLLDLAEIPTFQEIQEAGIAPDARHPTVGPYLEKKAESLRGGSCSR
jgi:hypothetical protein